MTTKAKFKRSVSRFIQDHRRSVSVRLLARAARFFHDSWEHPGYDITENGEAALLRSLSGEGIRTIFDVGANVGDWSLASAAAFPGATVHSFEPVPATFAELQKATSAQSRVVPHPFGLADRDGEVSFTYYGEENSFLSTMAAPIHDHLPSSRITVGLRRGDTVVSELATASIDFLKVDVEGMEYEVLEGLKGSLSKGLIGLIQFEKQPGRRLLKDYFTLLGEHGYRIGKIYSGYVDFRPYDSLQERTAGPNYLAVPAKRGDLIGRLQDGLATPAGP